MGEYARRRFIATSPGQGAGGLSLPRRTIIFPGSGRPMKYGPETEERRKREEELKIERTASRRQSGKTMGGGLRTRWGDVSVNK